MSQKPAILRDLLVASYEDLSKILSKRLGSADRAADALQETYVRLLQNGEPSGIGKPWHYLVRMAQNIGVDRWRSDHKKISVSEGWEFLNLVDETPDPEREVGAKRDLQTLIAIVRTLPPRRRAIFAAAWIEGLTHQEIAARFGLALRTVRHELKLAREYCGKRLRDKNVQMDVTIEESDSAASGGRRLGRQSDHGDVE